MDSKFFHDLISHIERISRKKAIVFDFTKLNFTIKNLPENEIDGILIQYYEKFYYISLQKNDTIEVFSTSFKKQEATLHEPFPILFSEGNIKYVARKILNHINSQIELYDLDFGSGTTNMVGSSNELPYDQKIQNSVSNDDDDSDYDSFYSFVSDDDDDSDYDSFSDYYNEIESVKENKKSKTPKYIAYPVLYGTNRKLIVNIKNQTIFNGKRDDTLHLGMCNVSIPESHRLASVERPTWLREILFGENPNKHFTILNNEIMEEERFIDSLRKLFAISDQNDVLLFIHGYNVKFSDAIYRAAQLGYDLNFKGVTTAFSWPSTGTLKGYVADLSNAEYSATFLSEYIKTLISNSSGINKLHIIAHSMGNVVLCNALKILREEKLYPSTIFNQVILAAPDIDQATFINQIWPSIRKTPNITLYTSNKDKALGASEIIRDKNKRLGEGGDDIFVSNELDSIDASLVRTDVMGHGYFSSTQSLLTDIYEVLSGKKPYERMLLIPVQNVNNQKYWKLKKY